MQKKNTCDQAHCLLMRNAPFIATRVSSQTTPPSNIERRPTSLFDKPDSSVFTKSTPQDIVCSNTMWCERLPHHFILNISFCHKNQPPERLRFKPETLIEFKLEIILDAETIDCRWLVVFPWIVDYYDYDGAEEKLENFGIISISTIVFGTPYSSFTRNTFSLTYKEEDIDITHHVDQSDLLTTDVTIESPVSLSFFLHSTAPHLAHSLVMTVQFQNGNFSRRLPAAALSKNIGYVTTPIFDGIHNGYPYYYRGVHYLNLLKNESVMINFFRFELEEQYNGVCVDFLVFTVGVNGPSWTKCGRQVIKPRVYQDSIKIELHSDQIVEAKGFKMIYAVLPRNQEPQMVNEGVFNCSVPYYEKFAPALRCNMVMECAEGEDERDCEFHSQECGQGLVDAGAKCLRFVPVRSPQTSWNDANVHCLQNNETLVTFATREEYDFLVRYMTHKKEYNSTCLFVGAQLSRSIQWSVTTALMYKQVWRWADGRSAFFFEVVQHQNVPPVCAVHWQYRDTFLFPTHCSQYFEDHYACDFFCEKVKRGKQDWEHTKFLKQSEKSHEASWKVKMAACPSGHVTRDFLSCDRESQCGMNDYKASCHIKNVEVDMFVCEPSLVTVHYTLLCDRIQHCPDNADEEFCYFSSCSVSSVTCLNGQCLSVDQICDRKLDCVDASDEDHCDKCEVCSGDTSPYLDSAPFIVDLDGFGKHTVRAINSITDCPATHFSCLDGACLPLFLRCNNVDDCAGREDELECETYTCRGFYRCRGSTICLHPDHMCDGVPHCPYGDDEQHCNLHCPQVCQCQGLAFVCSHRFNVSSFPELRYLDASSSNMTLDVLDSHMFLVYASLQRCGIRLLHPATVPNLRHLDLGWNQLSRVDMSFFFSLNNLRVLNLTRNPVSNLFSDYEALAQSSLLRTIDLSHSRLQVFNGTVFTGYSRLKRVNISWSLVNTITHEGFRSTPVLEVLDTRHSPLTTFPTDVVRHLAVLKSVHTDNFKLCCRAMLPVHFDRKNCHAKEDLLASCGDLFKSNAHRICFWVFAAMAIIGNAGRLVMKIYVKTLGVKVESFGVFVTSLTLSDLLMGSYLAIVGAADLMYRGQYIFHDLQWKNSTACSAAGFLSLLSSELSAFNICLITLDRILVLWFSFSRVHFSRYSAIVACGVIWTVGLVVAVIPLLPVTSHWQFFSQTGICIPLLFTGSDNFPGHTYWFAVMVVLNFILFMAIVCGQVAILLSVPANTLVSVDKDSPARDAAIARRMTTIIVSDFLCWFSIGMVSVLTSIGTVVTDELNVGMTVFILPVNSALNPFLYTLSVLMEKRKKARMERLMKKIVTQKMLAMNKTKNVIRAQAHPVTPYNEADALASVRTWLESGIVTAEDVMSHLHGISVLSAEGGTDAHPLLNP